MVETALLSREGRRVLHIVRVLALVRSRLDVAAVELVVQHIARVLLGFFGGVWVVEVGLVAADDVAWVGHFGMGGKFIDGWKGLGWLEVDVVVESIGDEVLDDLVSFWVGSLPVYICSFGDFRPPSSSIVFESTRLDDWRDQAPAVETESNRTTTSCSINRERHQKPHWRSSAAHHAALQ